MTKMRSARAPGFSRGEDVKIDDETVRATNALANVASSRCWRR